MDKNGLIKSIVVVLLILIIFYVLFLFIQDIIVPLLDGFMNSNNNLGLIKK